MKFARYEANGRVAYGVVEDGSVTEIEGSIYGDFSKTSTRHDLNDVKLLVPCEPTKVLAVGLNYASHLGERKRPEVPGIFFKTLTSLLDPEGTIVLPRDAGLVEHEGELVIVIGKRAKSVSKERCPGLHTGVHRWQRCQLQALAARRPAMVASQGLRHLRPPRPLHRH